MTLEDIKEKLIQIAHDITINVALLYKRDIDKATTDYDMEKGCEILCCICFFPTISIKPRAVLNRFSEIIIERTNNLTINSAYQDVRDLARICTRTINKVQKNTPAKNILENTLQSLNQLTLDALLINDEKRTTGAMQNIKKSIPYI